MSGRARAFLSHRDTCICTRSNFAPQHMGHHHLVTMVPSPALFLHTLPKSKRTVAHTISLRILARMRRSTVRGSKSYVFHFCCCPFLLLPISSVKLYVPTLLCANLSSEARELDTAMRTRSLGKSVLDNFGRQDWFHIIWIIGKLTLEDLH